MKLTVLGCGSPASPRAANRYPPGYLVEFRGHKLLFECSEGIRFRLEQAGHAYTEIQDVAISHAHPDHYALIHFLQPALCPGIRNEFKNDSLNIYCPKQVAEDFPKLWGAHLPEMAGRGELDFPKLNFVVLPSSLGPTEIGGAKLTAARVYHGFGKVDALAFRLETPEGVFAYSGDTGECPGIREVCRDADLFACECSSRVGDFQNARSYGHLSPHLAGDIAKKAGVKTLVLVHYTGIDSDEVVLQDCRSSGYSGDLILAKDFMVV